MDFADAVSDFRDEYGFGTEGIGNAHYLAAQTLTVREEDVDRSGVREVGREDDGVLEIADDGAVLKKLDLRICGYPGRVIRVPTIEPRFDLNILSLAILLSLSLVSFTPTDVIWPTVNGNGGSRAKCCSS